MKARAKVHLQVGAHIILMDEEGLPIGCSYPVPENEEGYWIQQIGKEDITEGIDFEVIGGVFAKRIVSEESRLVEQIEKYQNKEAGFTSRKDAGGYPDDFLKEEFRKAKENLLKKVEDKQKYYWISYYVDKITSTPSPFFLECVIKDKHPFDDRDERMKAVPKSVIRIVNYKEITEEEFKLFISKLSK